MRRRQFGWSTILVGDTDADPRAAVSHRDTITDTDTHTITDTEADSARRDADTLAGHLDDPACADTADPGAVERSGGDTATGRDAHPDADTYAVADTHRDANAVPDANNRPVK